MNREKVLEILESLWQQQISAILGGIVGGEEAEAAARKDENMYKEAYKYAKKNLK